MRIKFLMAEEFRPEPNNKITVLGLFAGETLILNKGPRPEGVPEDAPIGLERLAFMLIISDLDGTHDFKGSIFDPNGQAMSFEQQLGEGIMIEKGMSHIIINEVKPFIIKAAGTYTFVLHVDDNQEKFSFEIRLAEPITN